MLIRTDNSLHVEWVAGTAELCGRQHGRSGDAEQIGLRRR